MSFTRKQNVILDGVEVLISPLTCLQVDEFLADQEKIIAEVDIDADARGKKLETLWYKFIVSGLNNANPELRMTAERLRDEFDKPFLAKLKESIMEMSGIGVKRGEAASA